MICDRCGFDTNDSKAVILLNLRWMFLESSVSLIE